MTDDERFDIDLGALGRALARNWLVIVVLMVVGVVAAVGVTVVTGKRYQAASAVYLGQPTDANGNAISGINSNPRGAAQIVQSADVLKQVVSQVGGISVARLRAEVTVDAPTTTVKSLTSPTNFVTITVIDRRQTRAVDAANALGRILVSRISQYADQKISLLQQQLAADKSELSGLQARITKAQDALAAISSSGGTAVQRATAGAPMLAVVQAASTLQDDLLDRVNALQLSLVVARDLEQPSLFSLASLPAQRITTRLPLSIAAGLVAGLIVGIVAALVRERMRKRRPV